MRGPILYFFLLVLEILLDLGLDASYKQSGFAETLPKKGLEFVPSRRNAIVAFNLSFLLLLAEVNLVSKKQGQKGDAFVSCDSNHIKMIFTLLTEVIILYM